MYFYVGRFRDPVYYGRMPGHLFMLCGRIAAVGMLLIGVIGAIFSLILGLLEKQLAKGR